MSKETKVDNGGYVYPNTLQHLQEVGYGISLGITRRDWLAGLAMQGLLTKAEQYVSGRELADVAYKYADAMIAEGRKGVE